MMPNIHGKTIINRILVKSLLFCIVVLVSCNSFSNNINNGVTKTSASDFNSMTPSTSPSTTESFTPEKTLEVWPSPIVTATPINIDIDSKEAIEHLFDRIYFMTACKTNLLAGSYGLIPTESFVSPKPEFIEVNPQSNPDMQYVNEMADNEDKSYHAFVACNRELCQPKIYVEKISDGKVYEINWKERMPWRDIQAIVWIDHDVLAFYQSNSPYVSQVLAVDVEKKNFVYFSLVQYNCPLPSQTP